MNTLVDSNYSLLQIFDQCISICRCLLFLQTKLSLKMQVRQLYGGSIEALIPTNTLDASEFRQIPDNQEVFVGSDSDDSIIIELLEPATILDHFEELLQLNGVFKVEIIEKNDVVIALLECSKFNSISTTTISLGKSTQFDCDILVTIHSDKPQREMLLKIIDSIVVKDASLFQ
jgi:hypothetical protein